MPQRTFFDIPEPLARTTDPVQSHDAIPSEERLGELHARAFDAVRRHPGRTAQELTQLDGLSDPRTLGRRIYELARKGLVVGAGVRRCGVTDKERPDVEDRMTSRRALYLLALHAVEGATSQEALDDIETLAEDALASERAFSLASTPPELATVRREINLKRESLARESVA